MKPGLFYRVGSACPAAHLFVIDLEISTPDPDGQIVSLPAWVPGSYLIRDFARNIVSLAASSAGSPVQTTKLDKSTWQCAPVGGPLLIRYQVYAKDRSVRGAHLDQTHGFFDGSNVFLRAHGQEDCPVQVSISRPEGNTGSWRLATGFPGGEAESWGFGEFHADNFSELIDYPVEMGDFEVVEFAAGGVPHAIIISGKYQADSVRLATDLALICEQHIQLFSSGLPIDRYVFLLTVLGDGYGGLEHRNSASLFCRRDELPVKGETGVSKTYRRLLGLCSHEYFHLWNVKRLRPASLAGSDLSAEVYTEMLWVFEGVTSYYDDLALVRSGVISQESYLDLLSRTITRVLQGPGRFHQSLAESSFDAWSKFYRQNENSPNAIVSYYAKGSLVALALDLLIRTRTDGERSLDDVMRAVWRGYGHDEVGMPERSFEEMAGEVSGLDLADFFDQAIRGTDELPLAQYLESVGVTCALRTATSISDPGGAPKGRSIPVWLGIRIAEKAGRLMVTHVLENGPGQNAGVSAGDELLAMNDIRLSAKSMEKFLRRMEAGDKVKLNVFREDILLGLPLVLETGPEDCCQLALDKTADEAARAARAAWLGLGTQ